MVCYPLTFFLICLLKQFSSFVYQCLLFVADQEPESRQRTADQEPESRRRIAEQEPQSKRHRIAEQEPQSKRHRRI